MAIKYFKKDLTPILKDQQFQVFAHGCNCYNTMGAGIARTVAEIFPSVWEADQKTGKGDHNKLGKIDVVAVSGDLQHPSVVVNAYTQFKYWGKEPNVNYAAIKSCFSEIYKYMKENGYSELTIPKIGAGLAGGDWKEIEQIIMDIFPDSMTVNVYYLQEDKENLLDTKAVERAFAGEINSNETDQERRENVVENSILFDGKYAIIDMDYLISGIKEQKISREKYRRHVYTVRENCPIQNNPELCDFFERYLRLGEVLLKGIKQEILSSKRSAK